MKACAPRIWGRLSSTVSHLLYTDATGAGGLGATLILADNPRTAVLTLSGVIPAAEHTNLLQPRYDDDQELFGFAMPEPNAIYLLELFAVLASLRKLRPLLRYARLVIFIDNEAAKSALIKGDSSSTMARWIVGECWHILASTSAHAWFERVPSLSNPADAPSRGLPLTMPSGLVMRWEPAELKAPTGQNAAAAAFPRV